MGVVFQARHIFLKTQHAIKIILPDLVGNDPMLVTRFRQEALAAAAVRHPNIISVTDFGVVRGTMPFLVMEFVKGKSLQEIMAEEGAMPAARAFEIICPTASGVAAAHRQNIVHRDLKPLNIMIQDNMPVAEGLKILDFGLAKIKSGELLGSFVQAKTSGLMGSPFYMAPEQWSDEEPDSRADIYSLGIILYQMLSGDVPFKGASIPSIMKKHLTESPPSLKSRGVDVPPAIEAVVRHALAKEVGERTFSVDAFLEELKDAVSSVSATLKTTSDTQDIDPNQTLVVPPHASSTGPLVQPSGFETNFDPQAGRISAASLGEQLKQQQTTGDALKREQEHKERFAREELAREADHRERKRAEESAQERKEREQREEKDRLHRETLDRVAKQAEQLEEKLARLSTSMVGQGTAVVDPEATQVQQRTMGIQAIGESTSPGGQTWSQTIPGVEPKPKKSAALMIGVVLLLVVLAGGAVGAYFVLRPKPIIVTNGNTNGNINGNNNGRGETPPIVIKPDLIAIPGGSFKMGRVGATVAEIPVHDVTVTPFDIDRTEVTNAEYAQFVSEMHHAPPANWAGDKPIAGDELLPVSFVSIDDAKAFAEWRSKRDGVQYRLPTEEEWEYAARGGDQDNIYPWGNNWVEDYAVTMNQTKKPKPVGSAPSDKTRWGVMDMMGNVYEWTSSKAHYYPGSPGKVEGEQVAHYVIRGASYATDQKIKPISATRRDWIDGNQKVAVLGFRLVRPR
jgi:serine/threonine-protein kinase